MAVVIGQIVTEAVVAPSRDTASGAPEPSGMDESAVDAIVRRAAERVLETLRREWDR